MGRYIGPVCRLCRREGVKLYLKGERCYSPKCAMERRPYPPGQHGQKRARRPSDYAVRLREKQKLRRIYGISERQFRNLFEEASKKKGVTGSVFLGLLESRLDNWQEFAPRVQRLEIAVAEKSRNLELIRQNLEAMKGRKVGPWLSLDVEGMKGKFLRLPDREDLALPVNEQLVIEFYSR